MKEQPRISVVSINFAGRSRWHIAAAVIACVFFVGLHADAANKKEPPYTYKGGLMNQIRWQCATDCMHGSKVITGYVNIKKCTNKCIAKPPRSARELASEMQKICKKGPSDSEERRFCQEVSRGRDDFAEWMINKWNGTKTGCPLGATLKGKKCVCPKGTKINSEHTSCFEEVNEEKMKENLEFIQEIIPSTPTPPAPSQEKKSSPQTPAQAEISKALEGTTVNFSIDPNNDETKYVACQTDAQCAGEYKCNEHYVTLRKVCGKRPEGKSCTYKPEDAARDGRLFLCDTGDECVRGTCVKLASYTPLERSVSAWKCGDTGYADAKCQNAFGSGYYCLTFGVHGKLCARSGAPHKGLCLQQGCPDSNDSCIIAPSSATACLRSAP